MKFILAFLLFFICSCSSTTEKNREASKGNVHKQDTNKISLPQPISGLEITLNAYISYFEKANDTFYLGIDNFEFLTRDEAFEAAKKHGDLDTGYNEDGTIAHVGVTNDYYILNEGNEIRRFKLSKDPTIEIIAFNEASFYHKRVSANSFYDRYKEGGASPYLNIPFEFTFKNSEIISIKEIYIP